MAVTIQKKSLTITSLVVGLFPSNYLSSGGGLLKLANELENAGFKLSLSPSRIAITIEKGKATKVVAYQDLKIAALNLALANKVGYAVKTVLRAKITDLISGAHGQFLEHGNYTETIYSGNGSEYMTEIMYQYNKDQNKVFAIKTLRNLTGFSLKESKDLVETWIADLAGFNAAVEAEAMEQAITIDNNQGTFTSYPGGAAMQHETTMAVKPAKYKSTSSHIMNLKDAEHLHQAVYGSSKDSRYFVVALSDDVKVSARIQSSSVVSIRAVCMKAPQSKIGQVAKLGFLNASMTKKPQGHWSLHLTPSDMIMARRCIGSTLFAMGIKFDSISSNLSLIEGK